MAETEPTTELNIIETSNESNSTNDSQSKTAFAWPGFCDRAQSLMQLRQDRTFADISLRTSDGGEEVAHFTVLSALGDHLTNIISEQINSSITATQPTQDAAGEDIELKVIHLNSLTKTNLEVMVDYAYTGQLTIDNENRQVVWEVLKAAEHFRIRGLIMSCCTFICTLITPENCVDMLNLGLRLKHGKLRVESRNMIKRNFQNLITNPEEFNKLTLNQLLYVLDSDELNVKSEATVWSAITLWLDHNDSRGSILENLLNCLRHLRLKRTFVEEMLKHPVIRSSNKMTIKVKSWLAERGRVAYPLDGYQLPCGVFPKAARPRVPDSVLLAYGGWKGGIPTMLIESYDVATNQWYKIYFREWPQKAYCGIEYHKGKIYTVGGTDGTTILSSFQSFDPVKREWEDLPDMSILRCYVSTAIFGDELYAIGGHNGDVRMRSVEKYNFTTGLWSGVPDMNISRSDASAVVHDGKIYVAGGLNENQIESSMEFFDPETGTWTLVRPMSTPRTSLALVKHDGFLWALGGNSGTERLATVEKYDPSTNAWAPLPDMISRRSTFSAQVLNNQIYVVGGYNGTTPIKTVEYYDEVRQSWVQAQPLEYDRSGLALVQIGGLPDMRPYTYYGNESRLQIESGSASIGESDDVELLEID
ncbi:Kelch-like protein 10 [Halotydeus destructor]|nr:Kelch-like protein 10 [Halotydeus destructor]